MSNRTSSKSSFIGENSSGNTFLHAEEKASYYTSGKGSRMKGTIKNGIENFRNFLDVQKNYTYSKNNVKQRHKRNQTFCYTTNSFNTAKENHTYHSSQKNAENQVGYPQRIFRNNVII